MCLDSMSGGSKRHHVMEVETLETIHPKSCLVEAAKEGLEHKAQQYSASAIETHRAENQAPTPCFSDREPTHAMPHLKKKGFVLIYATLVNKGLICHGLAGDPEMSRLGRDVWVTVSFAMQVEEPVLVGKHANAIGLNHIFAI